MATRIPINKEVYGFKDKQKEIWKDMENEMERRRREWEEEIDKMRKEFFMLRPESDSDRSSIGNISAPLSPFGLGRSHSLLDNAADDSRGVVVKDDKGNPVFKVLFDVHDYRPEEVTVKMDANKIMVGARHEQKGDGSSVSREYSREVKLPNDIDPMTLQCTLGPDGILTVEAPLPAPTYASALKDAKLLPIKSVGTSSQSSTATSAAYKPTSTTLQNSAVTSSSAAAASPPVTSATPLSQSSVQQQYTTLQSSSQREDLASSGIPGYSKVSPSFQSSTAPLFTPSAGKGPGAVSSSAGRMASPPVTAEASEVGKFKLEVDIEDFKPDELTVKTQDKRVVVCARREEKAGNRTSTREMSREYTIPETVDPLTIKAFFTDGGKLIVEAPYRDVSSSGFQSHASTR